MAENKMLNYVENIDLNSSYLNNNTLDYIGSKKDNLKFLNQQLNKIINKDLELQKKDVISFFDLFSGSGVVARLAKAKGFQVLTNDLEIFAKIITEVPIKYYTEQVEHYFEFICQKLKLEVKNNHYYTTVVDWLNTLEKPKYNKNNYFSVYFAPKDLENVDKETERLYYTPENALKIDAIIEAIFNNRNFSKEGREIILASLLPKIIEVVNNEQKLTRSYQNKIGKGKREVKERVLTELVLEPIVFLSKSEILSKNKYLLTPKYFTESTRHHAESIMRKYTGQTFDFVYLDPPFNQQQYSNNYSHLISACENDKQKLEDLAKSKRFESRQDLNQSNFNRKLKDRRSGKKLAEISLARTFETIEAKYILYSYLPNSLLSIPEIIKIFSENGKNTIKIAYELTHLENMSLQERLETDQSNNIQHCLFIIEKNKQQGKHQITELMRELVSKSIVAENESFDLNGEYLNVFALTKKHTKFKLKEDVITKNYLIYKEQELLLKTDYKLKVYLDIDTIFDEQDKEILSQYIISSKEVENILNEQKIEKNNSFESKLNKEENLQNIKEVKLNNVSTLEASLNKIEQQKNDSVNNQKTQQSSDFDLESRLNKIQEEKKETETDKKEKIINPAANLDDLMMGLEKLLEQQDKSKLGDLKKGLEALIK